MRWWTCFGLLAIVAGCGDASSSSGEEGGAGGAAAPGCEVGEVLLPDGTCLPPGIVASECADGFVGDDAGGCVPELPTEPCEAGTTALPGDAACQPIADCGEAPWGEIPTDAGTIYVDASSSGGDGSAGAPFATIAEGVAAAAPGATVAVAAGSYGEAIQLGGKPVTVWGRCPSMVTVTGGGSARVTINGSEPVTVRGFELSGLGGGAIVEGAATLADLWIHDTSGIGVIVQGNGVATLQNLHIARVIDVGVLVLGATVEARDVVIRDVDRTAGGAFGRGWDVEFFGGSPGSLVLDRAVVERTWEHGVYLSGADGALSRVVVRDVTFNTVSDPGRGVTARMNDAGIASTMTLSDAVIERVTGDGVAMYAGQHELERIVVRDVAPMPSGVTGYGISYLTHKPLLAQPTVTVRRVLVERATTSAILSSGGLSTVDGALLRDMLPEPASGFFGRGVSAQSLNVDVQGITLVNSRIERVSDGGVVIFAQDAVLDNVAIDGVNVAADGSFGDAIDVFGGLITPNVTVARTLVRGALRAGIANFVGNVQLLDNRIGCNGIDLNGEEGSQGFTFDDQGGNVCGCEVEEPCKVLTTGLEPPGTPPELE